MHNKLLGNTNVNMLFAEKGGKVVNFIKFNKWFVLSVNFQCVIEVSEVSYLQL